jgi:2-aminoadipate transaminase
LRTDLLERALQQRPKFIYALPNFQNPSGATLTIERRRVLAELADQHDVPIVEDDPYAELIFEGEPFPAVTHFAQELRGPAAASLHLGTFSKTLAPGLRLGWIAAPAEVTRKIVQLKQGTDLHTSTFTQVVAHEIARTGFLDEHIRIIRGVYRERMLAMVSALEKHFPAEATWAVPRGGMFLWVRLPNGVDSREVLNLAVENKVAFVPGNAFFASGDTGYEFMRLNFSNCTPERIEEGVRRLGKAASQVIERARGGVVAHR